MTEKSSSQKPKYRFVKLDKNIHDRESFSCGLPKVDNFFKHTAGKRMRELLGKTYVFPGENKEIKAFYTIAPISIMSEPLDSNKYEKNIPALLIGFLGVNSNHKGQGLGSLALTEAISRCVDSCVDGLGPPFIVIDGLTEESTEYYLKRGFKLLKDGENPRLYMSVREVLINIDKAKKKAFRKKESN